MTKFQARLTSDKETLWKLVKLFHPNIPDEVPNNAGTVSVKDIRLEAHTKYDWVVVEFRARGYGRVSFGLENCYDINLKHLGKGHKLEDFQKTIDEGGTRFRGWRFVLDSLYDREQDNESNNPDQEELAKILTDAGYELQSAKEWYNQYYTD